MTAVLFLLLALAGFVVLSGLVRVRAGLPWAWSLSAGFGLLLASIGVLLPATLFLGLPFAAFMALWALVVVGCGFWLRKHRPGMSLKSVRWRPPDAWDVGLALAALLFAHLFVRTSHRWGDWDGWAQWSMHARFMASTAHWRALLSTEVAHPDYPLLQPAVIGACWRALGTVEALTPMLLSLGIAVALLAVVYAAVREHASKPPAVIACLVLCSDIRSVGGSASQYADLLLAFFMLLTVALLCRRAVPTHAEALLAGCFAACAAWTKNEGLAFFAVAFVALLFSVRGRWRSVVPFVVGSLPVLAVALWFKLAYAPTSDLAGASEGPLAKVFSPQRHLTILSDWGTVLFKEAPFALPALVVAALVARGPLLRALLMVVAMAGVYYLTYLLTPLHLEWHLSRSSDRLMHQLLPLLVFIACAAAGRRREAVA